MRYFRPTSRRQALAVARAVMKSTGIPNTVTISQMKHTGAQQIGRTDSAENSSPPIVFFDGVCGLCNRFIDFVLPRDHKHIFRFAPLQGGTAAERLKSSDVNDLKTVVLLDGNDIHRQTAAVVRVLWRLGGLWTVWGGLLWCIPRPLRDLGYKIVAANRYRWFGQKETCRMPSPEERQYFLP